MKRSLFLLVLLMMSTLAGADPVFAAEGAGSSGLVGVGAGLAIGLAALGGTLGQGKTASSALDSIGRNPSASGKMLTPMIFAIVMIESLVILSWVIANNITGKL